MAAKVLNLIQKISFILITGLVINPTVNAMDTNLGSLFTSAKERHSLNTLRKQDLLQNASDNAVFKSNISTPKNKKIPPGDIVLNGIIKKSNGKNTIWINGKRVNNKNTRINQGPDKLNRVLVRLPGKVITHLKPGQRLHGNSGKISENFSRKTAPKNTANTKEVIDDTAMSEL